MFNPAGKLRCIDLSLPLSPDLPVTWPGLPPFRKGVANWFADYNLPNGQTMPSRGGYYDQWLEMDEHAGTHVDFPSHILPPDQLFTVEDRFGPGVPLGNFAGPAVVIDAVAFLDRAEPGLSPRIPVEVLQDWEKAHGRIGSGEVVLIDTGYTDRYFRAFPEGARFLHEVVSSGQFPGWPVPAQDVFEWLADRHVRHLGISSPSIGALDDAPGPHRTGFLRGITFTESLIGLGQVPPRGAFYIGFPLNIAGQSGSPVRAVALVNQT